ncbi:MAG: carboxypeptidase-like regulatory domain-containing protein [Chitinophagales bacterium]|nr:carboxypeptidase-like regulatory domain-containing protein [Chitinophagales bacterium]
MRKFNCTEDELYEIGRISWNSCKDFLDDFKNLKALYTTTFIDDKLAAIDAAEALPDDQARGAEHEVLRASLTKQADTCLGYWLQLRRYIETAYTDPIVQKARLEEAGYKDYDKASNNNWEKVTSILKSGSEFIANHTADLTAGDNMPAGFATTYNDAMNAYGPILGQFKAQQEEAEVGTNVKLSANNTVYEDLQKMMDDGKFLYRNDASKRDQFVFEQVKNLVTNPGKAGLVVTVVEAISFIPLADASVVVQAPENPATELKTDVNGKCTFDGLLVGTNSVKVEAAGHVGQSVEVTIKTGVFSRRRFELVKI